jgi:hypothetical protein
MEVVETARTAMGTKSRRLIRHLAMVIGLSTIVLVLPSRIV